jgi:hypothetical protein
MKSYLKKMKGAMPEKKPQPVEGGDSSGVAIELDMEPMEDAEAGAEAEAPAAAPGLADLSDLADEDLLAEVKRRKLSLGEADEELAFAEEEEEELA